MAEINQPILNAPLYVVWEINKQCNANCIHCYTNSSPKASEEGILSADQLWDIADQLGEAKVIHVGISGGEPLLRKECVHLVERLTNYGIIVSLATNGRKVTHSLARELKNAGMDSVTVSLDSHVPEVHDKIRNSKGIFDKAVSAIKKLNKANIRVVAGMTAMRFNHMELEPYVDFLIKHNVKALNITGFVPVGRGVPGLDLSGEQLRRFLAKANELKDLHKGQLDIAWHDCRFALLGEQFSDYEFKGCGAANTTARITFDGHVTPCSTLPLSGGNLKTTRFKEVWRNSLLLKAMRNRHNAPADTNCGSCEHLSKCGGCRSISFAYTGDPWSSNPHCWFPTPLSESSSPTTPSYQQK